MREGEWQSANRGGVCWQQTSKALGVVSVIERGSETCVEQFLVQACR